MERYLVLLLIGLVFLGITFGALARLVVFIRAKKSPKTIGKTLLDVVAAPLGFSAIFLQKRKEAHLPAYFRYFLKFTRICSQVPYFHFFPKLIVGMSAEIIIHFVTHEPLLSALLYVWSLSFLIIITAVESIYGDFEEEVVTLANKIFLYCVTGLMFVVLVAWALAWEVIEPLLDNRFFSMMMAFTEFSNEKLFELWTWFWGTAGWLKILIGLVFVIYVSSSIYLSKRGIK